MAPTGDIQLYRPAPLWRRALAQIADLGLLLFVAPLFSDAFDLSAQWGSILPMAVVVALWQPIVVAFVAFWGATPGKMLMGLRVVVPGETRLGWRRAWNRQSPFLAVQFLSLLEQAGALIRLGPGTTLDDLVLEAATNPSGWTWMGHLATMLVWASALFVLMRPDRRGIHDLWADTVVVVGRPIRAWRA